MVAKVKADAKSEKNSLSIERKIDIADISDVSSTTLPPTSQLRENDGLCFDSLHPSSFLTPSFTPSSSLPSLASLMIYVTDSNPLMFRGEVTVTNAICSTIGKQMEKRGRREEGR